MKCKGCGEPHIQATSGTIGGLCSRCSYVTLREARSRGYDLEQVPHPSGHAQEIKIGGIKLFHWRGQWRAE